MKNSNILHRLIIAATFVIILAIAVTTIIFFTKNKANTQETVAKAVLTKTYGASLQDYEKLTNVLTESLEDSSILLDYLHTVYGEQLTENGYKVFLDNRIPTRAAKTAYETNADLIVTAIELDPVDAFEGSQRYVFTIRIQAEKDVSKSYIFKGNITLIKQNNQWRVDGISPE